MGNENEKTSETVKEFEPIQKSDTNQIRIAIKSYEGHEYVDVREYFKEKESGNWLPTKKGFTIPTSYTLDHLEDVIATLEEACNHLEQEAKEEINK